MRKFVTVALALSISCGAQGGAFAQSQRVDFKGAPMGISLEDLKASVGISDLHCIDLDSETSSCWSGDVDMTYAGQLVRHFSTDFLHGKLAGVSVQTLGGTGEKIEQVLSAKYGRPKVKRKVDQAMKNGAKYKMQVTEWRLPSGDEISIQDHPSPVDEVFVSLESSSWVKWRKRSQTATAKEKSDI